MWRSANFGWFMAVNGSFLEDMLWRCATFRSFVDVLRLDLEENSCMSREQIEWKLHVKSDVKSRDIKLITAYLGSKWDMVAAFHVAQIRLYNSSGAREIV